MTRPLSVFLALVAVGGLVGAGLYLAHHGGRKAQPPGIAVGTMAPAFSLTGQREVVAKKGFPPGRGLVLTFVTPTCRTCAAELRVVDSLEPKIIGPAGARMYFVFIDRGRPTPGQLLVLAQSIGAGNGLFTSDPSGQAWRSYRVTAPGTVFVIGADGRVAWRGIDPSRTTLRAHVRRVASTVTLATS